ncbi:MAG: hypothetical protein AAB489_05555, partial [Patescibacteria group bacterium]
IGKQGEPANLVIRLTLDGMRMTSSESAAQQSGGTTEAPPPKFISLFDQTLAERRITIPEQITTTAMDAWRILTGQDREGTIHALDSRVPDDSNRLKERICQLFIMNRWALSTK